MTPPPPPGYGGAQEEAARLGPSTDAALFLCAASVVVPSSPLSEGAPPLRRRGLSCIPALTVDAAATPAMPLALHRSTSDSASESTGATTAAVGGSKRAFLLSGLARLMPMGMPRTSMRYKRHLSCTDLDVWREEEKRQQLLLQEAEEEEEAARVQAALLLLQMDDDKEPTTPVASPTKATKATTRPSRIRRCVSMPAAPVSAPKELVVNFPGGGKFFYWQSGVATFLNKHFDLQHAKLVGASAGSLTATLMACQVDAHYATEVAVRLLKEYNVYERPLGLVGVWGGVVNDWLHEILPENAAELCNGRVHISVLCLPYRRHHVSDFRSKADLIDTCLASAHLPVVMDGKPFRMWRGWPCVDGSIMATRTDVPSHLADAEHITFDYVEDPELLCPTKKEFITLSDPAGLQRLVEMGYRFAERLSQGGLLHPAIQTLRKFENPPKTPTTTPSEEGQEAAEEDASGGMLTASSSSLSSSSGEEEEEEEEEEAEQEAAAETVAAAKLPGTIPPEELVGMSPPRPAVPVDTR